MAFALAAACGERKTAPAAADAPTPVRVAQAVPPPVPAPRPAAAVATAVAVGRPARTLGSDAGSGDTSSLAAADLEPRPPVVMPGDVLQGAAAEKAIGDSVPPPAPPRDPDSPALLVSPLGIGPYALGLPRQAVVKLLDGASLVRPRIAAGEPTIELGEVIESNARLLHLMLYGGRLAEVTLLVHDDRAVTAADIGVGSTFDDAELAHGEPRKVKRGWVLSALPGVIFVPADPAHLAAPAPPPEAKIGRLIVVGPESD